jgi:NAD(P)-dependent dehydrogenase (short-subunit alcohol dehydrogenase family)
MQGKVALITGGNSGIGRGIVHRFVRAGATVAFVGRNQEKGEAVLAEVHELGGQGAFFVVDLADESAVIKLVDDVSSRFARLDVVVNNAGIGSRRGGIEKSDPPGVRWQKLRGPNLDSTYFVSAYTLPLLERSGGGAIVNISSKAAVEALTRSFAVEGAPHGIRVNCVSPGWIATKEDEELSAAGTADGEWAMPPSLLNRMGTPAEIAAAVLFLASDDASFVTGQTLIVDGGLTITDYPSIPLLSEVGDRLRSS